jgi:hypothetical protein
MSIPVLLIRLQACDPALHEEIRNFYWIKDEAEGIDYECDEFGHHAQLSVPDEWEEDVIQGCCQRAIAAKGYDLIQGTFDYPEGRIFTVNMTKFAEDNHLKVSHGHGDSPASALLEAYCQACEGNHD